MTIPCQNERAIDMIDKRLDRMEEKIDTLLADKWKRIGAVSAISAIVAAMVSVMGWALR